MTDGPSIVGTGLRGSVERLLRSDIRQQDLHDLFFSMREESGGRGIVSEIGHFIAHPSARTQGITTQDVRNAFAFLKFRVPLGKSQIITTDVPANLPKILRDNLHRVRKSVVLRETGINRGHAQKVLERILARMTPTAGGGISKATFRTQEELRVFTCAASQLKGGSLFTDDDLFEDFYRGLQRQQLLGPNEKADLKKAKNAISLFALRAMHNRTVDLGDGSVAKLAVASDIKKRLGIFAVSEVTKDIGHGSTKAAIWVFETDLTIADHCELGVAPPDRSQFIGDLEVTPQLKLARP